MKPIILLTAMIVFGFLIVFILNSSTIMATYYKYSNDPNNLHIPCNPYWLQQIWDRHCVNDKTFGMWVCEQVGYNEYRWNYYTRNCAYGFKCGGSGQCYETPQEPILKIGDFIVNSTKLRPGDYIHEGLFLYNLGTGDAYVKVCGYTSSNSYGGSNKICKNVYVEHTGGGQVVKFNLKVNSGDNYAVASVYEGSELVQTKAIPIDVIEPKVKISYSFSKFSGKPGDTVDVYYNIYSYNGMPSKFMAKACIVPKYWNINEISNDLSSNINNEFCNSVNTTIKYGFNKLHITINVPKYGDFDSKYGFGSAWYGYGDYYIIGTTYKWGWNNNYTVHKSWKYIFTITNTSSGNVGNVEYKSLTNSNTKYYIITAIIIGGVIWYIKRRLH